MANLTGWLTGKRVRTVEFGQRSYCFNGANRPQCYDGVAWSYAGIENDPALTPPSPAFTQSSTGITGTYRYYVVPVNENKVTPDGQFERGIPVYWGETSPTNKTVTVNGIPATHIDPQVTHFEIYRNRNGYLDTGVADLEQPEAFYYIGHVTIGTTTYNDNTDDTAISSRQRMDFDRLYLPAHRYASVYAHRLFTSVYDDFSSGTVTVNTNTLLIDLTGSTFPDGVLGAWFQKDGEAKKYRIARRTSTTQIKLEEAFVGTLSGANYLISRDNYVIGYTEYLDAEACGRDGEENRYYVEIPEKQRSRGHIVYKGRLLVFTLDRCYWISAIEEDSPDAVAMREDPLWVGVGAVSGDAMCVADGLLYFLSLRGLCVWDGEGQPKLLDGLGTNWLDNLAPAQLDFCAVSQDPVTGEIVCSVPGTGQTENSLEYSFDPATMGFWPDRYTHPGLFTKTRDADGKPILLYTQGEFIVQRSKGTNDLAPSGTVTGVLTGSTTLSATDSTASFVTTGAGLKEAYIHFFNPLTFAYKGSRRIYSNTGTSVTWSSSGAGGGSLTLATGDRYHIGPVYWSWKTGDVCVPAHAQESLLAFFGVEPDTTDRYLHITETRDGTDKAVKQFLANKRFEQVALLQQAAVCAIKIESRETNATVSIRDITVEREVRGGTQ
jgi:hypothetical protein